MPVASADLITCVAEARDYYRVNLGGLRRITCCGKRIDVIFPVEVVHIYSEKGVAGPGVEICTQQIGIAQSDVRVFSLKRARLMDCILPAISKYTVSIFGQGPKGKQNKVLHGPRLPTGEYMRVVLKPSRNKTWVCVSAFPVDAATYRQAWNASRAKFPP